MKQHDQARTLSAMFGPSAATAADDIKTAPQSERHAAGKAWSDGGGTGVEYKAFQIGQTLQYVAGSKMEDPTKATRTNPVDTGQASLCPLNQLNPYQNQSRIAFAENSLCMGTWNEEIRRKQPFRQLRRILMLDTCALKRSVIS